MTCPKSRLLPCMMISQWHGLFPLLLAVTRMPCALLSVTLRVTSVTMCCVGPCYRCLFPAAPLPESCSRCCDAGVLGVIPGIIGSLQALEAIKIMAGVGQVASRKLVIFDGLAMRFHSVKLRARYSSLATPLLLVLSWNSLFSLFFWNHCSTYACHLCARIMPIISVAIQPKHM